MGVICVLLAFYALGTINANWTGLGLRAAGSRAVRAGHQGAEATARSTAGGIRGLRIRPISALQHVGRGRALAVYFVISCIMYSRVLRLCCCKRAAVQRRPATVGHDEHGGDARGGEGCAAARWIGVVNGELWEAESESGVLTGGEPVVVSRQEGFRLCVRRV